MIELSLQELAGLASALASELCSGPQASVQGQPARVAALVEGALVANFRTEAAIEREANKALAQLGRQTTGMDHDKLLDGIIKRIAKTRGFVL